MSSNERRLQTAGVNWLKMAVPEVMVMAVINELPQAGKQTEEERKVNMIRMMLMKQMGLYPGAADILLFKAGPERGTMWVRALETKDKAPQSASQVRFQKHWESIGGYYRIWRSLTELHDICVEWGLTPVVKPPDYMPTSKSHLIAGMLHNFYMETKKES